MENYEISDKNQTVHCIWRPVLLLTMAILFLWEAGLAQMTDAVVEGHVSHFGRMDPVSQARVTLLGPLDKKGTQKRTVMLSDQRGKFAFRGLPNGEYRVSAEADGYLSPPNDIRDAKGKNVVAIVVGQTKKFAIELFLVRARSISGQVTVDAVSSAKTHLVSAFQVEYTINGREVLIARAFAQTDNRGEYRLSGLWSDRYYVGVLPILTNFRDTDKVIVPTFYPNLTDARFSPPVDVRGGDITGIDIAARSVPSSTIRGVVQNQLQPASSQPSEAKFYLYSRNLNALLPSIATPVYSAMNRLTGKFEIAGMPPGIYELISVLPLTDLKSGVTTVFPDHMQMDVPEGNIENARIVFDRGRDITVLIRFDGRPLSTKVRAILRSNAPYASPYEVAANAGISSDGSGLFRFNNVPVGSYSFDVTGLPDSAYVSGVELSGAALDRVFRIEEVGPTDFTIHLKADGGTIRGFVTDRTGAAAPMSTVVVVAKQGQKYPWTQKALLSNNEGKFNMTGIPPGEYRILAWEKVAANAWANSEFFAKHEALAVSLSLMAAGHSDIQLKEIPREGN